MRSLVVHVSVAALLGQRESAFMTHATPQLSEMQKSLIDEETEKLNISRHTADTWELQLTAADIRGPSAEKCTLPAGARWCSLTGGPKVIKMACPKSNDIVCDSICSTGSWEGEITSRLTTKVFPSLRGKTFLDVGMNVGMYGILAASYGMQVIAFEPMPSNLELLHASFCANPDIAKNIKLHEVALSNEERTCSIISGNNNVGDGIISCAAKAESKLQHTLARSKMTGSTVSNISTEDSAAPAPAPAYTNRGKVSLQRLSKYLTGVGKIAYAKFDVEGHECLALKGGPELLAPEHRPTYIQTELWQKMAGCQPQEYLKMFSDAGYKVHTNWFDSSAGESITPNGIQNVFVLDPSNPQNVVIATQRSSEYVKQRNVLAYEDSPEDILEAKLIN